MYVRKLRMKLRPKSAAEFKLLVEQKVVPLLRAQKGFQDEITLSASSRNEAVAISFWDSERNADAYNHVAYLDVLRSLSSVLEEVPSVENFEMVGVTSGPLLRAISLKLQEKQSYE